MQPSSFNLLSIFAIAALSAVALAACLNETAVLFSSDAADGALPADTAPSDSGEDTPPDTTPPPDTRTRDTSPRDLGRSECDLDGDGAWSQDCGGDDCDDLDDRRYPDAADRVGNSFDENCDGVDGVDSDRDGFASLTSGGDDCDDLAPRVNPGADDICDGQDTNCDGIDATPDACGPGQICTDAGCVFERRCDWEIDCDPGETCIAGRCVGAEPAACDEADQRIISAGAVDNVAQQCGLTCLGPSSRRCSTECISDETGLSEPCAECYAMAIDCAIENCLSACNNPSSDACFSCQEERCFAPFVTCAGFGF